MKTLKQLALATAVLAVPFMAQAELKAMDDTALATVTGQDGISISGSFNGTIGSLVYTDGDAGGGSLRMETVAFTGFNISDTAPVKVDVVENASGTQQLQISLPTITGQLSVGAIKIGDTNAASIGSLAVNDMNMAGTTVKVWGH
ncbi:hypothetical protein SAMN05216370_4091 [Pseudomonas peli]|jgi:hypothetical protein|uniref:DUF6160 domain-containing protein n=1 Tax=Pseudomonas peli TaxID=592361 RepID=A0AB37ZCH6_9PSED|nr:MULTISPECIES: DUF6160 family protein [Pseudomonas]NMZ71136.1 hypothetical protein [Pseudomonas peli]SCW85918.1 hypothetical protein SAMN05216370_4091 [Pseudomonas peli]VXC97630.1 conserved exported hypothetical protein [Pseudomonas sp. 9AZ]